MNMSLSNNNIFRKINKTSEDIPQQLKSKFIGYLFAIQLDELVEELQFCKLQPGRATAIELL